MPRSLAYASWIDRHRRGVIAASIAVAVLAGWLASHLAVQADMSSLLPPDAESVQHLRAIEKRARVIGTAMVAIESPDPVHRATAAKRMRDLLRALPKDLISSVTFDDSVGRKFAWEHRWLEVSLADLKSAAGALRDEIRRAKLKADPLYIDLDDPAPATTGASDLRKRLRDAEAQRDEPGELVSKDGHVQLIVLRTAHSSGDVDADEKLIAAIDGAISTVKAELPDVEIGIAGDVVLTVAEHDAILNGMLIATVVTVVLVLFAMFAYYRSVIAVGALSWALMVGALATFGFTQLGIGHLNLATAFLSSIVIGNGINFGIMLLARYMEERRTTDDPVAALAAAIGGTLAGTFAAALTAAVAYGSLILTAFRGFRDFGIIAGVGILLCWLATYTVLPAGLAIAARTRLLAVTRPPAIGRLVGKLAPKRPVVRAIVMFALTTSAAGLTYRYLAGDPFENNFRNLRSHNAAIDEEQRWMTDVDRGFGQGISGGFVIAVADRAQVAPLVARLRKLDEGKGEKQKLFSRVSSLDDLLPADQAEKLAVLADIRAQLSDPAIESSGSAGARSDAEHRGEWIESSGSAGARSDAEHRGEWIESSGSAGARSDAEHRGEWIESSGSAGSAQRCGASRRGDRTLRLCRSAQRCGASRRVDRKLRLCRKRAAMRSIAESGSKAPALPERAAMRSIAESGSKAPALPERAAMRSIAESGSTASTIPRSSLR